MTTTTQGAIRRLELLLARTPEMECADDLRVLLADAVLSRRLLEGETEAHLAVTRQLAVAESKLADARRLLDDARAQKPVAYMHNKRVDVIHTSVKSLLSDFAVNSGPESMLRPIDKSENYTIPLYAAAPVPAQPAAKTVCDALEITNAIILDVCETDPADPSHPETVCINVDDLRETVERHILTAKGDGT